MIFLISKNSINMGIQRLKLLNAYLLECKINSFKKWNICSISSSIVCHNEKNYNNIQNLKTVYQINEFSKDKRIIFNTEIHKHKFKAPQYIKKQLIANIKKDKEQLLYDTSVPLILKKLNKTDIDQSDIKTNDTKTSESSQEQFPFAKFDDLNMKFDSSEKALEPPSLLDQQKSIYDAIYEDIKNRIKQYDEKLKNKDVNFSQLQEPEEEAVYHDNLLDKDLDEEEGLESQGNQYGTPNPDIPKSSTPCGGCGALLHCQDDGLPGYVPSQLFSNFNVRELGNLLCQRCYFLLNHNTALNVRVSPDHYEQALEPLKNEKALVIVVVDLLDVPCSIWPNLTDLIGYRRPVIIVGNKYDLLPQDSTHHENNVLESLTTAVKTAGLGKTNIQHMALISAKTGFGMEKLITKVLRNWQYSGDVYILGCTNAGKSTIFNALLKSDMCEVKATSLVRRATASPWPGTTLNLLKFPIMHLTGRKLWIREDRLREKTAQENKARAQFLPTNRKAYVRQSIKGHIGQTFASVRLEESINEVNDPFRMPTTIIWKDPPETFGIDKNKFRNSTWCYDTPGTVQPDQLLSLLTHDELLDVLPREQIKPVLLSVRPSQSVLIGGVVRIDLLHCPYVVRMSVCCSSRLPVTLVRTVDASALMRDLAGSRILAVPRGSDERMRCWPALQPTNVSMRGQGIHETAADVVLSSAGFVVICGRRGVPIELRAWTPSGRGVYARSPSMLPRIGYMWGTQERRTPVTMVRSPFRDGDDFEEEEGLSNLI